MFLRTCGFPYFTNILRIWATSCSNSSKVPFLVGRVDRIKDQMNKTHGLALTRSMVIRALIEKGAEQYELTKVEVAEPVLEEKTVVEGQA